jgi:transcriptional regulator with XRE-family HTH domain
VKRQPKRPRHTGPIHLRIAKLREAKNWSQEELADELGVDKTAVSHWENGISRPELSRIPDLAKALGVAEIDLVRGEPAWAVLEAAMRSRAAS